MNQKLLPQFIIAAIYTVMYGSILFMVFSGVANIDQDNRDIANILLGMLTTVQLEVVGFFFKSSSGSKDKDALNKSI